MKKKIGFIMLAVLIGFLVLVPSKATNAADPPGRIEALLQSTGVLSYSNTQTGDTIVIDSSDFYRIAETLDGLNAQLGR